MLPDDLVAQWEAAYRRYTEVFGSATLPIDRLTARAEAVASRDVATAWRALAAHPGLPWWALAAILTAAQAFDEQSQAYARRAGPIDIAEPVEIASPTQPIAR